MIERISDIKKCGRPLAILLLSAFSTAGCVSNDTHTHNSTPVNESTPYDADTVETQSSSLKIQKNDDGCIFIERQPKEKAGLKIDGQIICPQGDDLNLPSLD